MVGGRGLNYLFNLGNNVVKFDLNILILRYYDDVISMDWWGSHDAILNGKMRQLSWNEDEGQSSVIVGRKWGVSLRFIFSLQLQESTRKDCKLFAYLALNVKGVAKGLENLPVV